MKPNHIKHKQVVSQDLGYADAQLPDAAASCSINARANNQVAFQQIKCVTPMTFSQKLYQSKLLEIAEEFDHAIDANSLEEMKNLLDKLVRLGN